MLIFGLVVFFTVASVLVCYCLSEDDQKAVKKKRKPSQTTALKMLPRRRKQKQ